ncbi:MAG TPA: hypothetical protein VG722_13825 [Tepidisphaeraceae bacterium]|nr:hypothetical protein [Tepidisphaeraceae bacterium]
MNYSPAQPGRTHLSFAWRPTNARLAGLICAILVIAPLLYDLFMAHVNLSILFLLPLLFCAWLGQRQILRRILVLCIILTYLGLAARLRLHPSEAWQWSLLNRTFVAAALVAATFVLEAVLSTLNARSSWRPVRADAEQVVVEEVIFSAQRFAAVFAALALSVAIFIIDLITPGQLNFPILYCVPLLLIVWTRSHVWLWSIVSVLMVLAVVGWFAGERSTAPPLSLTTLMTNRFIAMTVLLLFALIIHVATSPSPKESPDSSKY